eukprot:EG_transcript_19922
MPHFQMKRWNRSAFLPTSAETQAIRAYCIVRFVQYRRQRCLMRPPRWMETRGLPRPPEGRRLAQMGQALLGGVRPCPPLIVGVPARLRCLCGRAAIADCRAALPSSRDRLSWLVPALPTTPQ